MAIYHFSGKPISRSTGKSAIASAAYRAGEKLYDERQEKVCDYSRKQGVVHKEVMLPEGAPEWMRDREKLWNEVERVENRKDAQLAREIHISLPRELSKEQNIELAREFVKNEFVSRGMIADLCIHDGEAKDGGGQPHMHVMLSLRKVTKEGFGLKERSWNAKENMLLWRESWAEHANRYLALNGIEQRIDHRSYAEQGIDLIPQNKIGPMNLRVHEFRVMEHQSIARENGNKILEDPSIALKAITYHQSTFTHQDLARFINRNTIDADQFQVVYEKVRNSEQVVVLGKDEEGRERLTTKEMMGIEKGMLCDADFLKTRKGDRKEVGEGAFTPIREPQGDNSTERGMILSSEQQEGLKHILGAGDIKCLVGYAGTGKSLLLGEAREVWEKEGYRVHGLTLAGIAAESLEFSSGIESRTLASRSYFWDRGEEKLGKKDILVVDEAGMLGSRQVVRILAEVKEGGAKAVFLGDPQQLQAIEAGAAFRAICELVGFLELTEIRRQRELWQREATKEFALQHTTEALRLYEEHGHLHLFETQDEAKRALVEKWNETRISHPEKTQLMLAYTRRDVKELNEMARGYRKGNNELGEEQKLQVSGGSRGAVSTHSTFFAKGERIYFLQNDKFLGVKNGSLGTIEKIAGSQITVKLDGNRASSKEEDREEKIVAFDINQYNHITHGYAATIHKAQAVTVDRSYLLASEHLGSNTTYPGMTRHRERVDLYWSREKFSDREELEKVLGRDQSKDVTVDYLGRYPDESLERELVLGGKEDKESKEDKTVSDWVREITALGKEHVEETNIQKYVRELKELTQQATQDVDRVKYNREIKEYIKEDVVKSQKIETIVVDIKLSQRSFGERDIMKRHIPSMSAEEKRAEDLVGKYYKLEDKYNQIKKEGRSRYDEVMAQGDVRRCAQAICKDNYAMDYLRKNNSDLFKEMDKFRKQEMERELQKGLQKGFELSL